MKSIKQKSHLDNLVRLRRSRGEWNTKETSIKISLANKGRKAPNKGIPMSEEQKAKLSKACMGRIPPNFAGGSWVYWRAKILQRDDYTCQICFLREPRIVEVAHKIAIQGLKNRVTSGHPLNSYENLITLCPNDHARFDKGLITLPCA